MSWNETPKKPWESCSLSSVPFNKYESAPDQFNSWPSSYPFDSSASWRDYTSINNPHYSNNRYASIPVLSSFQNLTATLSGIAHFMDSMLYAGWSSIQAISLVLKKFQKLYSDYLLKLLRLIIKLLRYLRSKNSSSFHVIPALVTAMVISSILFFTRQHQLAMKVVEAKCSYYSSEVGHISLCKGQKIKVLAIEDDWAFGEDEYGSRGCFPISHIS